MSPQQVVLERWSQAEAILFCDSIRSRISSLLQHYLPEVMRSAHTPEDRGMLYFLIGRVLKKF
jgi:hypothetical protein